MSVKAVVRKERSIDRTNQSPEGAEVLVTILSEEEQFWTDASEPSLSKIWNNEEDDIYEQLLKK
ncbi:MAG: hypothetical protein IPJ07_11995 [Acidobacteria bacterium]|nr:hypothetical protein [Acidobacteriota bacterium]